MTERVQHIDAEIERLRMLILEAYELADQIRAAFSGIEPVATEQILKQPFNEIRGFLWEARNVGLPVTAEIAKAFTVGTTE